MRKSSIVSHSYFYYTSKPECAIPDDTYCVCVSVSVCLCVCLRACVRVCVCTWRCTAEKETWRGVSAHIMDTYCVCVCVCMYLRGEVSAQIINTYCVCVCVRGDALQKKKP